MQVDGLQLLFEENTYCIKGGVATVLADNLAAHGLAGFSCSFNSDRICRFCMCHYDDLSKTLSEEDCVLGTKESHAYHLKCVEENPNSKSVYGVNSSCPFNKLTYFDTTQAFPSDVMHDFLEGIVPLVLKSVLKALHNEKTVSIQEVNGIIKRFSFGQNDCPSKPVLISEKVAVSGKAVQKWTLFRTFPFLIGNRIEESLAALPCAQRNRRHYSCTNH